MIDIHYVLDGYWPFIHRAKRPNDRGYTMVEDTIGFCVQLPIVFSLTTLRQPEWPETKRQLLQNIQYCYEDVIQNIEEDYRHE